MTDMVVRSVLFLPGDRPDMLGKVTRCRPDVVVVDLEDALAPNHKDAARQIAFDALTGERPGASVVLVRINPPGTPWHGADLAAAAAGNVDGVVLPKFENVDQLRAVRDALPTNSRVIVGIETALGVADVRPLLAARPDAVYFGAEDFIADLGGRRTQDNLEVLYARSKVRLAAHLSRVPAIDQAVVAVHDIELFLADASRSRDLGYQGKICLHPKQVEAAHSAFTPTTDEVSRARDVVTAAEGGVGMVEGQMVDAVHVAMAKGVLARAEES